MIWRKQKIRLLELHIYRSQSLSLELEVVVNLRKWKNLTVIHLSLEMLKEFLLQETLFSLSDLVSFERTLTS